MGVPDEVYSPVRKRPRLSLRGYRKLESQDNTETPETNVNKEADSQTSSGSAKKIGTTIESADLMADLPSSSEPLVPPVASLHNLGNTCFLNSMLEVLRFTPGFQSGIRRLSQEIESVEKLQEESHCVSDGTQLVWQIVKNAHQLFEEMESRERQYNQLATSDASSMAVGPSALLEIIRKLNPMFEGHFQHDAQELLRCLLCYVEDAEKEVRRAADRIKPGKNEITAEKPNPFRCVRGLTDVAGLPQPKGDAHGEVALKGGDSRRKEPVKELRRARRRQRSGNLNDSPINTSLCELSKSSSPTAGQNSRLKMEMVEGGDAIVNPSTPPPPANRLKRKRSKSSCQGRSDQPSISPILISPRAGNGNHKKMVKVDSFFPLRNGSIINFMRPLDNSNNGEPRKQLGECRIEGSPLLQDKVTLSHNSHSSVHQDDQAPQPSHKSISPFSETKLSDTKGQTGIHSQAQPATLEQHHSKCCGKNIDENRTSVNWRGDDNNNNDDEDDLETSIKGDELFNNSADSPILIDSEEESPKPTVSPAKKHAPFTAASPTKLLVYSPLKSPRVVEVVDEISILPECSSAFFESTIDSVTKKYFSSLSPARLRTSSPSKPVVPEVGHFSPETLTFPNIELIVEGPTANVSTEIETPPKFTEEMHVTVHSPYKAENEDCGSASTSITARPTTPLCKPTLGPPELRNGQPLCSLTNTSTTGDEYVHLLHPSSDSSYATSPGQPRRDPQQGQRTKKQSLSAPNTPVYAAVFSPLGKTACRFPVEIQDRSLTCQSSKELQLRLKKCDWLGVSPVKSVSARKALSVLASGRYKGAVGAASTVRRKIFENDDDGSSSGKNVVQDLQQHNKDVLPSSQQQTFPETVDTEMGLSAAISYNSVDNASSSSGHSKTKRKKKNLNNSLSVSLRPRKRNSQPDQKDGDKNLNPQVEPLKRDLHPKDLVSVSKAGLLKTLTVSLDKCDWLLSAGADNKISARQAMLDMKKSAAARRPRGERQFSWKAPISKLVKAANSDDVTRPKSNTVVDHLFGGTMMHRTKCLECEMAKERQEVFMDISIPVRSLHAEDVDSDEEGGENSEDSCLDKLMQAFSNIERLKDNNKYFCEECIHYVEAERSCHYSTLPLVLTLHLKRFGSTSGRFGSVSKLNDKVAIPQNLPCLQYNCKNACTDPTHRYSLFAIVTHSGMSVFHGHYRAYVKVQPAVSPEVFANLCKMAVKSEPVTGDAKKVAPDSEDHRSEVDSRSHSPTRANLNVNKLNNNEPKQEVKCEESDGYLSSGLAAGGPTEQRDEVSNSGDMPPSPGRNHQSAEWDCFWLECDDECIRVLEEGEFMEKLEEKDGALMGTPYILFYHKMVLA